MFLYVAPPELWDQILTPTHSWRCGLLTWRPLRGLADKNISRPAGISISLSHSRGLDTLRFLFRGYPLTLQLSTVIVITDKFPIDHRRDQGYLAVPAFENHGKFSVFPTP